MKEVLNYRGKVYFHVAPKRVQKTRDKKTGEFGFVELDDYVEPHWEGSE